MYGENERVGDWDSAVHSTVSVQVVPSTLSRKCVSQRWVVPLPVNCW